MGYWMYGSLIGAAIVALLAVALLIVLFEDGPLMAAIAAAAYFFVLPLIFYPALQALGCVPARRGKSEGEPD